MACYLLNISVDTPDGTPYGTSEDLSINDQESLIELVVEQVLGFENAIAEYDDPDADDQHKKNVSNTVLFPLSLGVDRFEFFKLAIIATYSIIHQLHHPNEFLDIDSPPPKS